MFRTSSPRRLVSARAALLACALSGSFALSGSVAAAPAIAPAADSARAPQALRIQFGALHSATASGTIRSGTASGTIRFGVRNVGRGARAVTFSIDGRRRWTTRSRPFRYHHTGLLNTRTLRQGIHTLTVSVVYRDGRVKVASRRLKVANTSAHPKATKPPRKRVPKVVNPPGPTTLYSSGPLSTSPVAFFNRVTYSYSSALSIRQEATRYQVLVMQSTDVAQVALLKAANPNLKILMYSDPLDVKASDPTGLTTCTDYTTIIANHPDWLLLDTNGAQIHYKGDPDKFIMDVGNPAYQQACLAHATALATQRGFDGIFWDDLDPDYANDFGPGEVSPKYPSNVAWQAAYYSLITYSGPQAHAQGLLVMGNISRGMPAIWQQWNAPMDGAMEEAWVDAGRGTIQQAPYWTNKLRDAAWSESNGKYVILHSYNGTETGNTYGLGSMLLAANGHSSYATSNTNYTSEEQWYPEYTTAEQLGRPTASYTRLPNGAYTRTFQNGIVLVNPSNTPIPSLSLGGVFSGSGLTNATTAALAPTSALILLRVG